MKFSGKLGFWIDDKPKKRGDDVYVSNIVEHSATGDILTDSKRYSNVPDQLNDNFISNTRISIVARGYCLKHWMNIRYVVWYGMRFEVTSVQNVYPRVTIELGGIYHGETERTSKGNS